MIHLESVTSCKRSVYVCVCARACVCACVCVCACCRILPCLHLVVGSVTHQTVKVSCNPAAVHHCCTMQVHRAAETKIHHISPSLLSPPTPSDRLAHRLVFEEKIVVAKDANVKNVDSYDIHDPRNPMTQRRREKPKHRRKD